MSLTHAEINELMEQAAQDAILVSKEEFDIELDKSVASAEFVDQILFGFIQKFAEQALEDQAIFTLCNIYGAYIGEVFRTHVGGEWEFTSTDEKEVVMLNYKDYSFAFTGICYDRLAVDSTISVKAYLEQAIENCR